MTKSLEGLTMNELAERNAMLVTENQRMSKRISELEVSETQLISERDNAEEALSDMYQAATGERPEWSNWFGFADAVDAVEQRLGDLESRQLSVKLPSYRNSPDMHTKQYYEAIGFNQGLDAAAESIRAAGCIVEGGK